MERMQELLKQEVQSRCSFKNNQAFSMFFENGLALASLRPKALASAVSDASD